MEKEYLNWLKESLRVIKEFDGYDNFYDCITLRNQYLITNLKNFLKQNPLIMADKSCIEMFMKYIKDCNIKSKTRLCQDILPLTRNGNSIYNNMEKCGFDFRTSIHERIKYVLTNPKYVE